MSYTQRIINDRPIHFFPLYEGANPFVDATVNDLAVVLGSPVLSPPLVVGGGNAYVFTGNDNFRFPAEAFQSDSVLTPFSLEAWFKPVNITGPKGIIGHGNQADGLSFDGEKITFSTMHVGAGEAAASYFPPSTTGTFHVVGVHTGSKNELYVNGVRVASTELTDEQLAAPYEMTIMPGSLYVGHMAGSIIIDAVAVYPVALTGRQAKLHFLWGRDVLDFRSVVSRRGGTYWEFSDATAQVLFDFKFDTDAEWSTGESTSTSIANNILGPAFDDSGLTREGSWQAGFILGAIAEAIDGSKISWDSDGPLKVQTSLNNGTTWTDAENGREVPGVGQNFVSGEQSLEVRVWFPAGEPADTITRIRSLSIKMYERRTSSANLSEQEATFSGNYALAGEVHQPIEHEDIMGLDLYNATASVPLVNARTIEMWVRPTEAPAVDDYLFDSRPGSNAYLRFSGSQWSTPSGTTVYVNGEEKAGAAISIPIGRWTHVVAVLPAVSNSLTVLGDRTFSTHIGMFAAYPVTLGPNDVAQLYDAYLGKNRVLISEASGLQIDDVRNDNIKMYAHSWSLRSSG